MARANFSDLVQNPRMKKVLSDCSHLNSNKLGRYTLTSHAQHCCTSGPQTWYLRAGISLSFWGGGTPYTKDNKRYKGGTPVTVDMMLKSLARCGMEAIWQGTGKDANRLLNSSKYLRPGDVAAMIGYNSAHGAMWTGEDWRSDYLQGTKVYPYSAEAGAARGGPKGFVLWRHKALADPDVDIHDMHGLENAPSGDYSDLMSTAGTVDDEEMKQLLEKLKTLAADAHYPVRDYDVFGKVYGDLFTNSELNAISQPQLVLNSSIETYKNDIDNNIQGRIYSTNDALIVLDELALPVDYKEDSYVSSNIISSVKDIRRARYDKATINVDYKDDIIRKKGESKPQETQNTSTNS